MSTICLAKYFSSKFYFIEIHKTEIGIELSCSNYVNSFKTFVVLQFNRFENILLAI